MSAILFCGFDSSNHSMTSFKIPLVAIFKNCIVPSRSFLSAEVLDGLTYFYQLMIIIIMEIYKAPSLRLKALNKHSITHIMYIEMENVISN